MAKKRNVQKEAFTRWDAVDHLKSEADIAAYFEAALAENDPALITAVLGDIAKARGMLNLADATGMTRQGLYKALAEDGNPSFATVFKVTRALGLEMKFIAHARGVALPAKPAAKPAPSKSALDAIAEPA